MNAEELVIRPGAAVEAADGRLGTVDEVRVRPETGELAGLVVRRGWTDQLLYVDGAQVERVGADGAVRLRSTREGAAAGAAGHGVGVTADGAALRVPILAERLVAEARPVDLGELRIRKRVDATEETVRRLVERDEVEVERVPVNRPLEAPIAQHTDGEWLVLPVMEEVLVVRKQLMLKEEVRVRTRRVAEEQTVRATVRRERVDLEDATLRGVRGLDGAGAGAGPESRAPAPAKDSEAAQPASGRAGRRTSGRRGRSKRPRPSR